MTPLLELDSIRCSYKKGGWFQHNAPNVIQGVSLRVNSGEVLGIVGESGSGKTTLIKVMLGLLRPTEGKVVLNGRPAETFGRLEKARFIQTVFQDPYSSLNPNRSVLDIVAQPLHIHRIGTTKERTQRASEMSALVGLTLGHQRGQVRHLSGGQRQRVAIARALMLEPKLLICDEPTSALDVSVQAQILNLLLSLQEKLSIGIVFVTHNLAVVEHIATHVAVLSNGTVVEDGTIDSVVKRHQHPYTKTLLDAVLSIDGGRERERL